MSDGAGITIPFDPEGLDALGEMSKAAQAAGRELAKLDSEMIKLAKKGKNLDESQVARYVKLENQKTQLEATIKQQRAASKQAQSDMQDYHRTERVINRLRHTLNSPLVRKLATGQGIDASDIVREIFASEKLVMSVGRALGASAKVARTIAPALMVGFEAFEITSQIMKSREAKEKFADEMQRQLGRGEIGRGLMAEFRRERGKEGVIASIFGLDPAKESIENIKESAKLIDKLDPQKIEAALNAASDADNGPNAIRALLEGGKARGIRADTARIRHGMNRDASLLVKSAVQNALAEKHPTNETDRNVVISEAVNKLQAEHQINLTKSTLEALKAALADEKTWSELQERAKSPDEKYVETQKERVFQLAWDIHRHRVSVSPTD